MVEPRFEFKCSHPYYTPFYHCVIKWREGRPAFCAGSPHLSRGDVQAWNEAD